MPGGSCAHTAAAAARGRPELRVVTGVNLAMLLDFVFHRELPLEAAAERAVQTGRASVAVVPR
jgi:mannose/fructose-specific phosphotransferase system component IIA